MNANYTYSKLRREFGRQCSFVKSGPTTLANVTPDPSEEEEQLWSPENPVDKSTNKSNEWSEHEVIKIKCYLFLQWYCYSVVKIWLF